MGYGNNVKLPPKYGTLVWWKLPKYVNLKDLSRLCKGYEVNLTIPSYSPDIQDVSKKVLKSVFTGSTVVVVSSSPKYKRYQISCRKRVGRAWEWDTVEFVRVFNSGKVICEWSQDRKKEIEALLHSKSKLVPSKALNNALCRYMEKALEAIPMGNVYLVPVKHSKRVMQVMALFQRLLTNATWSEERGYFYFLAVDKAERHRKSLVYHASIYFTDVLHKLLSKALVKGKNSKKIQRIATREKHKLKRQARYWESELGSPLYVFRRALADAVVDYPEIQDEVDEFKQKR